MSINDMGIQVLSRDPGTGYHQPYGTVIVFGEGIEPDDSRLQIDLTSVRPAILSILGVNLE